MANPRKLSPLEEAWFMLEPPGPPAGTDGEEDGVDGDAVGDDEGEETGDKVWLTTLMSTFWPRPQ